MTVQFFLKIDGIDGESVDAKHKGEIDVESFSWGESQAGQPNTGLPGKAVAQDFHFVARMGKQSPKLLVACATGAHFKTATLTGRNSSAKVAQEFLKLRLTDLLVTSYQTGGSAAANALPVDQASLNFTKIEMFETSTTTTGLPVQTFGGFDFRLNQVVPPPSPG